MDDVVRLKQNMCFLLHKTTTKMTLGCKNVSLIVEQNNGKEFRVTFKYMFGSTFKMVIDS